MTIPYYCKHRGVDERQGPLEAEGKHVPHRLNVFQKPSHLFVLYCLAQQADSKALNQVLLK